MRLHEDRSARSLVNAAGFHSDNTVLNDVDDADAMLAAQTVQLTDDVGDFHFLAIYGGRNTLLEGHGHILALIGSFLRGDTEDQKVVIIRLA